jgi:hypothetical protein
MYLLYDMIQRRKSALGNSLFVKRGDYKEMQQIISSLNFDRLITAAQSLRSTQTTLDPAIGTQYKLWLLGSQTCWLKNKK